ncbi:MAG: hypothetical protein AUJ52_10800 [Elusimicrobia bacterium CG1_02_63_36]|nr:MAG: hypothetical protein AUJ52_10800 [Elusimicrobia bacterium CG1_02_63_36]PIP82551.1 MAG: hypothetical protein COR54_14185 [Elusimicrobia bacterium CG22_combo_CG10-13_8_21_14_all_63_91]PJA12930.1 MAG: hypothetical protein COX66_16115 [Elusimicrobia bacterium CG_4_10_14_0_2_um_filter_63_34]PJB25821.1 MAG: hypothetical protein CO113_06635 [Elusimicrobia bacterium CG_4_9_14_3_um_filter_62_55]
MKPGLAALSLSLLVAVLVYGPRLDAPLMWDDRPMILNAAVLDRPLAARDYLSEDYFRLSNEATWRPLATLSYAVVARGFGKRPSALRAAMLLLHFAVALLLCLLVASVGLGAETGLFAAALFLVHPVHIETLMCVSYNEELIAAFGVLAMLLARGRGRPGLAALALGAALLGKETGAVGIVLAAMQDALEGGWDRLRERRKEYALYAAVTACYLAVRFGPLRGPGGAMNLSASIPLLERLYYAAQGLGEAAALLAVPAGLRIEYFALPPASMTTAVFWPAAAVAVLGGVLYAAHRRYRDRPAVAFFLLWPLPILALTSNVIPAAVLSLRPLAERWLYLPAAGAAAAAAWFLRRRPRMLFALIVFWGALAMARAQDWRSESRLWGSLVAVYPWSAKAHEGLGEAYYREGDYASALASFEAGLHLREGRKDPLLVRFVPIAPPGTLAWESPSLYRWMGLCRMKLDDPAGAVGLFEKAVSLQPADLFSYRVLAYLAALRGDFPEARRRSAEGLARAPADSLLLRLDEEVRQDRLGFRVRFE